MSHDVIKRDDFRELYAPGSPAEAASVLPGDRASGGRYASARIRFRELLERLAAAEERERRNVEKAAATAREEARAEARAEYEDAVGVFRAAAESLQALLDRQVELATHELIDLSTAIASKIVRREIRRDEDYLLRLVRRCLSKILQPSAVRVRLHPEDRDRVAAAASSLVGETDARHQLAFESDPRVERGGCVVEIPEFIVDARRDTQLTAAAAALGGKA